MSNALREFNTFLKVKQNLLSKYEKKLARIILENFAEVEKAGNAGGKRGRLLAKLVTDHGDLVSEEFPLEVQAIQATESSIARLSKLTVRNFRGFSDEHTLEFKNPYTFVYGPNGTGKSSFCEALEYSLLGSISEAGARRMDIAEYVKNANTGKAEMPTLKYIDSNGNEADVLSNPQAYEFCFIEKNRIEGFARVSAHTPQAQQERLAALFGLEDFNMFVGQFNEHFDNYLDCFGVKAKELAEKEKQIVAYKKTLEALPGKKDDLSKRGAEILSKFPESAALLALKQRLSGTAEETGLIQKNNAEIAELGTLKYKQNPGIDDVLADAKIIQGLFAEREEALTSIAAYKDELSLRDLYAAILQNQEKFQNNCPACESELYKDGHLAVPVNPYSNAAEKIAGFEVALNQELKILEIDRQIPEKQDPALKQNYETAFELD